MIIAEQYRWWARYNTWMNERLYAQAATLSDADRRRDLGAFFRSLHGTLNHVLWADRIWMWRFTEDATIGASRDRHGNVISTGGTTRSCTPTSTSSAASAPRPTVTSRRGRVASTPSAWRRRSATAA